MTQSAQFDVVIVGGGVIGMACAEVLSRSKLRVCIVEKDELGRAASWAGGGLLSPLPPDQCPDAIRPLLDESLALYPDWCARLQRESGIDPEYWVCGGDYYKNSGEHIEYPQMAQVRNPRLMKALVETLHRRGVSLLSRTAALAWITDRGRIAGVRTSQGDVTADAVILAAGAWSGDLLGGGLLRPVKGQMLLLRAEPGALPRLRIGDNAYLIPRRDGHILVGSTLEEAGFDLKPTATARQDLLGHAAALWPEVTRLSVVGQWAGLRPRGPEEAPILRTHPTIAGLWIATAHFRLGITLAPGSAQRLAEPLRASLESAM